MSPATLAPRRNEAAVPPRWAPFRRGGRRINRDDISLTVDAYKKVIEMYLTIGRMEDALRHGNRQMKANKMEKLFISFVKKARRSRRRRLSLRRFISA
jgi:hypothetical protein